MLCQNQLFVTVSIFLSGKKAMLLHHQQSLCTYSMVSPCVLFSIPPRDPDGLLPISRQQEALIRGWKRAKELVHSNVIYSAQLAPEDLTQGNPSDCSVIASLAVCLHHHKTHASRVCELEPIREMRRVLTCLPLSF